MILERQRSFPNMRSRLTFIACLVASMVLVHAAPGMGQAASTALSLLEEGRAHRAEGWPRDAQAALEEAVALDPGCHEAWRELGELMLELGDLQASIGAFDEAARGPEPSAALRGRGLAHLKLDRLDMARSDFAAALDLNDSDVFARALLGLVRLLAGDALGAQDQWRKAFAADPPGAIDAFRRALQETTGHDRAGESRKARLSATEKLMDAIRAFKQANRLAVPGERYETDDIEIAYELDQALSRLLELERSLAAYSSSLLRRGPGPLDRPAAVNDRGVALHELGRYREALAVYDLAMTDCGEWGDFEPACVEILVNRGRALAALDRNEEAQAAYRQAIHHDPESLLAFFNLGNALRRLGLEEEAVEAYLWAVEIDPGHAETRYNLGNAYAALGRGAEAESAYLMALTLRGDYAEASNNLGVLREKLGREEEAAHSYRRALKINPRYVDAHYNLASALSKTGRADEALETLARVMRFDADSSRARTDCGAILSRAGRHEEAVAEYELAIAQDPRSATAHYDLAQSLKALERFAEAAEAFALAAELEPANPEIWSEWGRMLAGQRLHGEALPVLRTAVDLDDTDPMTLYALAETCRILGKREQARRAIERLRAVDPETASSLLGEPISRE